MTDKPEEQQELIPVVIKAIDFSDFSFIEFLANMPHFDLLALIMGALALLGVGVFLGIFAAVTTFLLFDMLGVLP